MSDNILIDDVALPPDLQWIDEFADGSDLIGQVITPTITGALIVQANAQQAGRRITLQGRADDGTSGFAAITRAQVNALRAKAAVPGATYTLEFSDGRTFNVLFRRDEGAPVEAAPLKIIDPPDDADLYYPTIRLLQV